MHILVLCVPLSTNQYPLHAAFLSRIKLIRSGAIRLPGGDGMRGAWGLKLSTLLLAACLLWSLCGAPLRAQEWQGASLAMDRALRQLPQRMPVIWQRWLLWPAATRAQDSSMRLRVWDEAAGRVSELGLESYAEGVVAAEMPAQYSMEALRCQAIAARTRAAWSCLALGGNGCATHPSCDVCTSSRCCQGYLSPEEAAARWGDAAGQYGARIHQAVASTSGLVLTWDGLPIEMLYHACSGGRTEDAAAVFAQSHPYLVSVDSPGEEGYSGYLADTRMTRAEAARRLLEAFPGCGLTVDGIPGQLRLQSTTASGRISAVLVGSKLVTGAQFRQALGLRSTLCTWDADGDEVVFHTRGYGHGVGMSQAGAQAMASAGADYRAILAHYYPGTALCSIRLLSGTV